VSTPLQARAWAEHLAATRYPSVAGAVTLVTCIRQGVDLGYRGERVGVAEGKNLLSASLNTSAIDKDMHKQQQLGRRVGPCDHPPAFPFFRVNPLGVVFKKGNTLKPRVVHHLSWPRNGNSVNKSITEFRVTLDAFDSALSALRACGRGACMGKIDIEAAYRCIPVRPVDWPLQGMKWREKYFFDIVMQFGLASATAIFEWYSSAAQHIAKVRLGIEHLVHYIDDFLVIVADRADCGAQLQLIVALFAELGLPVARDKLEGPCTSMVFLGILLDSLTMTARLDEQRLAEIGVMLREWAGRKTASREQLQSLIGVLSFAAKVVRSSRIFLRRMIDQLKRIPAWANSSTRYPLADTFYLDLQWWATFVREWNGVALVPTTAEVSVELYTDACVTGYSAVCGQHWYAGTWTQKEERAARRAERDSMPWKELHALVRACATFGPQWKGKHVLFHCDCEPVVLAVKKTDSKEPSLAELIRILLLLAARNEFTFCIRHIAGEANVCADLLSRGQVTAFKALQRGHSPLPTTPLPPPTLAW
jgi:hypothetical protein